MSPLPSTHAPRGVEQTYFDSLAKGVWRVPRCGDCGQAVFYPRQICPHCGGAQFDWFEPSGRGVIHSTTTVRRSPEAGGDYNVCLVDLEEGFRMMSRVEDAPATRPRIGDAVRAEVRAHGDANRVVFSLDEQA
ncbi:OB-fold domain-containing protein [Achromobacter mucicolens]|uniref:Zn-ribbon domain-containing OB-fold protein n=1 Tax=Achromobacter mucicolens TaxID=1389922 RepID=UPI00244B599B|nr:OB-fold domain-containing protein [Achromobacter mucicolens]MDH0090440.1 OB-fold domain-containing protein [Achromobacter mucicolens]